jgi:hypothetical protein
VHNEARYGCPSVIAEDLKCRVDDHVREKQGFTVDERHEVAVCFATYSLRDFHSDRPCGLVVRVPSYRTDVYCLL